MKNISNLAIKSACIAIIINIVLAFSLYQFATKNEINPPHGPGHLPFKSQIMHILVSHKEILGSSSLVIGVGIILTIYIANLI